MRVSVVIGAYNRQGGLVRALQSVKVQTRPPDEIIVVDDGSYPPIELDDWPDVRLIRHVRNLGAAAARNTGVRAATGELVAFLDTDDTWRPHKLERQIPVLEDASEAVIGSFTDYYHHRHGNHARGGIIRTPQVDDWYGFFCMGLRAGPGTTLVVKRSAFEGIGYFDEDLRRLEDWDWLLRAAKCYQFECVNEVLADVHYTDAPPMAHVDHALERIEQKYAPHLQDSNYRRLFVAAIAIERAAAAIRGRNLGEAFRYSFKALRSRDVALRELRVAGKNVLQAFRGSRARAQSTQPLEPGRGPSVFSRMRTQRPGACEVSAHPSQPGQIVKGSVSKPVRRGQTATEIYFVISSLGVGGTEQHVTSVARELKRRGYQVTVYCLTEAGPLAHRLTQCGVRLETPPMLFKRGQGMFHGTLGMAASMTKLFGQFLVRRPSIVHFFLPPAYFAGAPLALLAGLPHRIMSRRSMNFYQSKFRFAHYYERRLHKSMSAVVGNSSRVVDQLIHEEGVDVARVGLIYSGIDVECFTEAGNPAKLRTELGLTPDTYVMVIVANLIPYKGHADAILAVSAVRDHLPEDWRLLLAGRDDGIGRSLDELAEGLGLGERCARLGSVSNVSRLLGICDVAILSSHEEGFPNVVLEYMAAGLPVVACNVGGVAEAVVDGQTGLVVPPRDPGALGDAIARLANDPALSRRMGEAGRTRVSELFTLSDCVDNYEALYQTVLMGETVSTLSGIRICEVQK